jgi:hypothetical protein
MIATKTRNPKIVGNVEYARELLSGLVNAFEECIEYRKHSIADIRAKYIVTMPVEQETVLSYSEQKQLRLRSYEIQPRDEEIQFIEDEDRLYRAQVAFCKLALPADTFED